MNSIFSDPGFWHRLQFGFTIVYHYLFPVMLHSTLAPENSMTAYAVAAGPTSLRLAAVWWPIALALTLLYFAFISRRYAGKVSVQRDTQGFY